MKWAPLGSAWRRTRRLHHVAVAAAALLLTVVAALVAAAWLHGAALTQPAPALRAAAVEAAAEATAAAAAVPDAAAPALSVLSPMEPAARNGGGSGSSGSSSAGGDTGEHAARAPPRAATKARLGVSARGGAPAGIELLELADAAVGGDGAPGLLAPARLVWGAERTELAVVFLGPLDHAAVARAVAVNATCEVAVAGNLPWTAQPRLAWDGDGHVRESTRLTYTLHCPVPEGAVAALRTLLARSPPRFPGTAASARPFAEWAASDHIRLRLSGYFAGATVRVLVPHTWASLLDRNATAGAVLAPGQLALCYCTLFRVPDARYTFLRYMPEVIEYYLDQGIDQIALPVRLAGGAEAVPRELAALLDHYAPHLVILNATDAVDRAGSWYHGQVAVMNECVNRYRDLPRVVLVSDTDELFWSANADTVREYLLRTLAPGLAVARQWPAADALHRRPADAVPMAVRVREYAFVVGLCHGPSPSPPRGASRTADALLAIEEHANQSATSWSLLQYRHAMSEYRTKYAVLSTLVGSLHVHHPIPDSALPFQSAVVAADPAVFVKLHAATLGVTAVACAVALARPLYEGATAVEPVAVAAKLALHADSRILNSARYQTTVARRTVMARAHLEALVAAAG